jgi:hypothetical protein
LARAFRLKWSRAASKIGGYSSPTFQEAQSVSAATGIRHVDVQAAMVRPARLVVSGSFAPVLVEF